jgi:hypothetical protein
MGGMSAQFSPLNQIGTPPARRTIHRRPAGLEGADERPAPLGSSLLLSIISFGVVIGLALLVAWLVL